MYYDNIYIYYDNFYIIITIGHDYFNASVEGHISECLLSTEYHASRSQGVDELKLKLSNYNQFFLIVWHRRMLLKAFCCK